MDPHGQRGAAGAPIAAPGTSARPSRKRLLADEPVDDDASSGEDFGPHVPATAPPAAAAAAAAPAPPAAAPAPAPAASTRCRFKPVNSKDWIQRYASPATLDEASKLVTLGDVLGVWSPSGSSGSAEIAAFVATESAASSHERVRVSVAADGAVHDAACSCYADTILFCPHVAAVLLSFVDADVDTRTFRQGDTSPRAAWGLAADVHLFPQPLVDEARVQRRIGGIFLDLESETLPQRTACNLCDAQPKGARKGCCLKCGVGQLSSRRNEAPLSPLLELLKEIRERATALLDSREFESCVVLCEATAQHILLEPLADANHESRLSRHGSVSALAGALIALCMLPACDPSVPKQLLGRIASVTDRVAAAVKNSEGRWQAEAHVARTDWGPLLRSILDGSRKGRDGADLREELSAAGETQSSLRVRVAGLLQRSRHREALRLAKAAGDAAGVRKAQEALGTSQRELALEALSSPAETLDPKEARAIAAACREDAPAAAFWLLLSAVRAVQAELVEALDRSDEDTKCDIHESWSESEHPSRRREYEDKRRRDYRRAGASFVDDLFHEDSREEGSCNTDDDSADESNRRSRGCVEPRRAGNWPLPKEPRTSPKPAAEGAAKKQKRPQPKRAKTGAASHSPWEPRNAWTAEVRSSQDPDEAVAALEARLRNLLACAVDLALSFAKRSHGRPEGPPGDNTLLRVAARAAAARLVADPAAAAASVERLADELASLVTLEACALVMAEAGRGLNGAWRAAIAFRKAGQPRLALFIAAGTLRPGTHPAHALYCSEDDGTQGRAFLRNLMKALEKQGGDGGQAVADFKSGRNGATADALFSTAACLQALGKIDDALFVCTKALELAATPEQAPYAQTRCDAYMAWFSQPTGCTMHEWLLRELCPKASVAAVRAALASPALGPERVLSLGRWEAAQHLERFQQAIDKCKLPWICEENKEAPTVGALLTFHRLRILGPDIAVRFSVNGKLVLEQRSVSNAESEKAACAGEQTINDLLTTTRTAPPELATEAVAVLPLVFLVALSHTNQCGVSPAFADEVLEVLLQSVSFERLERVIVGEMLCPEAAAATAAALFDHAAKLEPEAPTRQPLRHLACAVIQRAVSLFVEWGSRRGDSLEKGQAAVGACARAIAAVLVPALPALTECVGPAAAVECGRMLWPDLPRRDLLEGILACLADESRAAERDALYSDARLRDRACSPSTIYIFAMYCATAFLSSAPEHALALMRARAASCPPPELFCLLDALVRGYADAKGVALPKGVPPTMEPQPTPTPNWAHVAAFARECVESALRLEISLALCAGGLLRAAAVDAALVLELLPCLILDREKANTGETPTFYGGTYSDTSDLLKWAAAAHKQAGTDNEWEQLRLNLPRSYRS